MGLLKSRDRFSNKGLGNLEVREVSPTNDAAYQNLGNLAESQIQDIEEIDEIKDENGSVQNALTSSLASRQMSKLQQVSIDEISYIQQASGKYHSIRYSGLANDSMFQYFCFPYGRIIRKIDRPFTKGPQSIPFEFLGLKQDLSFEIPEFYFAEAKAKIRTDNLQLWLNARSINAYNYLTDRVLDISGFERHGQLNSDFASIWKSGSTPERSILFDGINDGLNCGDVLNDDASGDIILEAWLNIKANNGVLVPIVTKKSSQAAGAGWGLYRSTANVLSFTIYGASGIAAETASQITSASGWVHILVSVDRNGIMQCYLNGAANGAPSSSIAGISSGANAINLYTGRDNTNYGYVEIGGVRIYRYGAGFLPGDVAAMALNHFTAERSYYGI